MEYFGCNDYVFMMGEILQCVIDDFFVVVVRIIVGGIKEIYVVFQCMFNYGMVVFFWQCLCVIIVIWFVKGYIVEVKLGNVKVGFF